MYCHNAHVKIMDFDGPDGGRDEVATLHFDGIDSDTLSSVINSIFHDDCGFFDSAIAEVTFVVEP